MNQPDWPANSKPPQSSSVTVEVHRRPGGGESSQTGNASNNTSDGTAHERTNHQQQQRPQSPLGWLQYFALKILGWRWAPWFNRWNAARQTWETITTAEFSKRTWVAWVVAVSVDAVQLGLLPMFSPGIASPFEILLDSITTIVMTWLLGFHVAFIPSFAMELVPMVDIAPTWIVAVWIATRKFESGPGAGEQNR